MLALVGGLIVFYCLTSPKTRKSAFFLSLILFLIILVGYRSPEDYQKVDKFSKEYQISLAGQGETLAQVGMRLSKQTPLEQVGDFLVAVLGITSLFALTVIDQLYGDEKARKYVKQIGYKCLSLLIAVTMYLLSLYYGLEINILPYIRVRKLRIVRQILTKA